LQKFNFSTNFDRGGVVSDLNINSIGNGDEKVNIAEKGRMSLKANNRPWKRNSESQTIEITRSEQK
jgi:hypothetical protein